MKARLIATLTRTIDACSPQGNLEGAAMGWRMTSDIIKAPWPRFVLVLIASIQLVKGRVVSD